jgi:hypothetical protein
LTKSKIFKVFCFLRRALWCKMPPNVGDETSRGRNVKGTKRQGDETTWDETARGRNDHKAYKPGFDMDIWSTFIFLHISRYSIIFMKHNKNICLPWMCYRFTAPPRRRTFSSLRIWKNLIQYLKTCGGEDKTNVRNV